MPKKRKSKGGSGKGFPYERIICRLLSLWWSGGKDDFVFWRTSGSGGRATQRAKGNKLDRFHHGDIAAVNPVGQPLMDLVCLEAKRGYSSDTPFDMLDRSDRKKNPCQYEEWFAKCRETQLRSGSFSWLLVVRRDYRREVVFLPYALMVELRRAGAFDPMPFPYTTLVVGSEAEPFEVCGMTLDGFLGGAKPEHVRKLARKL